MTAKDHRIATRAYARAYRLLIAEWYALGDDLEALQYAILRFQFAKARYVALGLA